MKKIRWILITIMAVIILSACGAGKSAEQPEDVIEINGKINQFNLVETFPYYYADESIKLIDFYKKVISGDVSEYYCVDLSNNNQYKRSLNNSEYLYFGELKDNYPSGVGVVFKRINTGLGSYYCIYAMSDFEKGYVNGYSLCYDVTEELENIQIKFKDDYEGYYEKGKVDGDGVIYYPGGVAYAYVNLNEDVEMLVIDRYRILSEVPLSQTCILYIGENNGLATGEGTIYSVNGNKAFVGEIKDGYKKEGQEYYENQQIRYEGEYKENYYHGEGKLYYENGQLKYKGKFKNNVYHGKGVLYDENGNVIHDGKFKNGEID